MIEPGRSGLNVNASTSVRFRPLESRMNETEGLRIRRLHRPQVITDELPENRYKGTRSVTGPSRSVLWFGSALNSRSSRTFIRHIPVSGCFQTEHVSLGSACAFLSTLWFWSFLVRYCDLNVFGPSLVNLGSAFSITDHQDRTYSRLNSKPGKVRTQQCYQTLQVQPEPSL